MKLKLENDGKKEKSSSTHSVDRSVIRKRMLIVFGGVISFIIVLMLILFIISLFNKKQYSYVQIENILKEAAIEYYSHHKGRLPDSAEVIEAVDDEILVRNEYMKPLNEYLKEGVNCIGKVEVDYNNGNYLYTPYLECGKAYSTVEFYKKVTAKKNLVTTGFGLYNMNNEYVYRGEEVRNYISLDGSLDEESLWRIVKFTSTGEAVLIKNRTISQAWDDRYNVNYGYSTGINDYPLSRIKDRLKIIYASDKNDAILTEKAREKLVVHDLCIGKRSVNHTPNDNSAECSSKEEKQIVGLLPLSDYLNVSTDPNCNSIFAKACQNYNYLKDKNNWWLLTAVAEDSSDVYRVSIRGNVEKAKSYNMSYIRPVVHLSSKAMYKKGNGSINDPYQIR